MKSKIIALLQSFDKKPILILALIFGAWVTTATTARAQFTFTTNIVIEFPSSGITNYTCDGTQTFYGQDWDTNATQVAIGDVYGLTGDSPWYSSTTPEDGWGSWEIDNYSFANYTSNNPFVSFIVADDDDNATYYFLYWSPVCE
jgi:hypothetical protein